MSFISSGQMVNMIKQLPLPKISVPLVRGYRKKGDGIFFGLFHFVFAGEQIQLFKFKHCSYKAVYD